MTYLTYLNTWSTSQHNTFNLFLLAFSSLVITERNPYEDGDETEYDTEHDSRKRAVATRDIVHCISLRDYFQQKISDWGNGVGQAIYTDTITHIDCETASSLKEYISL